MFVSRDVISSVEPNTFVTTAFPARRPLSNMSEPAVRLDAREIDGEPFGTIMDALDELDESETLLLVNSFEPKPLYQVLDRRGFDHETEQVAEDEYRVSIRHA